jgi:L-ascorbate metabolism protein UlaG (beta-lactamase superfamily)
MKIIWHGHSCFEIVLEQWTLVIDPYGPDTVPGFKPLSLKAHAVFCSHQHGDHNYVSAVQIIKPQPLIDHAEIQTFHDDASGKKRGANTIHIFSDHHFRVAHLGDLGCDLTAEQKAGLMGLDAIMVPVGGHYTIDARTAKALMDRLQPRVVIPMHYHSSAFGYPVLAGIEAYTALCNDVVQYDGNSIELTPETKKQTAVLAYR